MHAPDSPVESRSTLPGATSLDPHETNVGLVQTRGKIERTTDPRPEVAFRHSGWSRQRSMIFDAMCDTGAGETRKKRFANCGDGCWCFKTVTQPRRYKLAANYCHDRFCKPCTTARGQTVAHNVNRQISGKKVRFLTLTLKSDRESLEILLDRLAQSFRRLRSSKAWKAHVTGGISFTEIKWNADKARWHVHAHMLIEGRYWPQGAITQAWQVASRGSTIVDIRAVNDHKKCTAYIVKYATKSIDAATIYSPRALRIAMIAIKGRRTMTTFGSWRGVAATEPIEDGDWIPVAPLRDLINQRDRGDAFATWILSKLRRKQPWTKRLHTRAPPPCPYDSAPLFA